MTTNVAVEVTAIGSSFHTRRVGILVNNPQVGQHCNIYLGGDKIFRIANIKGWMGPVGDNWLIVFDGDGKRFRLQVIATPSDFLL